MYSSLLASEPSVCKSLGYYIFSVSGCIHLAMISIIKLFHNKQQENTDLPDAIAKRLMGSGRLKWDLSLFRHNLLPGASLTLSEDKNFSL